MHSACQHRKAEVIDRSSGTIEARIFTVCAVQNARLKPMTTYCHLFVTVKTRKSPWGLTHTSWQSFITPTNLKFSNTRAFGSPTFEKEALAGAQGKQVI